MKYREFGRTGWKVSEIGFGTWAIGSSWGPVDERNSMAALNRAVDLGVNFFDTADAYGSEPLLAKLRRARSEPIYIVTKLGRRLNPFVASGFNRAKMTGFVNDSLKNLGVDTIDLIQLHCPPTEVYYQPEVFGILDDLVKEGKLRYYGVSVEKIDEALKAIEYPNVQSVQIIFNIFRQRPAEDFFPEAKRRKVAVLARVPLASGLLTGKMTRETTFAPSDHRSYNREGEAFDRGETFSGVDFDTALQAVEELRPLVPPGTTMAQFALHWILMHDAVSAAIPGAKTPQQAEDNARSSDLMPLSPETMAQIRAVYDRRIRALVHHLW